MRYNLPNTHYHRLYMSDTQVELLAAMDLGSNSFHLTLARAQEASFHPIVSVSEKVQLAAGIDEHGVLSQEAIDRGVECLKRFAVRLEATTSCRIVATNALRQAKNADQFVAQAAAVLSTPIEVIAGREEARLIFLGVAHTSHSAAKRLVIDIGGGSTELIIGTGFKPKLLESIQMGAVTFTQEFFADGRLKNSRFKSALKAAKRELGSIVKAYKAEGWSEALGSSGTIKAVRDLAESLELIAPFSPLTSSALNQLIEQTFSYKHVDDLSFLPIKSARRNLLPAGLAIIKALFESFEIQSLDYSDGALREGVLLDLLGRNAETDVRDHSVHELVEHFGISQTQAARVKHTAVGLFEQLELEPKRELKKQLKFAATLHELGLRISHSKYHHHGAYVIENADLAGFSRSEQAKLATLVRCHRRKLTTELKDNVLALGGESLVTLCLLLRLSVLTHHARSTDTEPKLSLTLKANSWQLQIDQSAAALPLLEADLENEARQFANWGTQLEYDFLPEDS